MLTTVIIISLSLIGTLVPTYYVSNRTCVSHSNNQQAVHWLSRSAGNWENVPLGWLGELFRKLTAGSFQRILRGNVFGRIELWKNLATEMF